MLGHNADPAVRAAWLDDMFPPPDVLEWALNVVVVRSGGRTILIDAGMGAEFPESFDAEEFLATLERLHRAAWPESGPGVLGKSGGARRDRTADLVNAIRRHCPFLPLPASSQMP
jgi:hypothetical protein